MSDREILFKAKRLDNGEWVEGGWWNNGLILCSAEAWIKVDRKTLSQYTGLLDEKGNKIWEHDMVLFKFPFCEHVLYEIIFSIAGFGCHRAGEYFSLSNTREDWQVVGNIFDNPELMEKK